MRRWNRLRVGQQHSRSLLASDADLLPSMLSVVLCLLLLQDETGGWGERERENFKRADGQL